MLKDVLCRGCVHLFLSRKSTKHAIWMLIELKCSESGKGLKAISYSFLEKYKGVDKMDFWSFCTYGVASNRACRNE